MGDIAPSSITATNSDMVSISAKILVATIVVVFFMLALLFVVHFYAKWYWSTHEDPRVVSWRRRAARQNRAARAARGRGLDPSALKTLPEMGYDPKGFKEGLECSVCLSEVTEGEKIRLLPKCNHGFHTKCIDMWFQSHATCPLCRNPVISDMTQTPSTNNDNDNDNNNGVELQENDVSSSSESETDDDHSSYESAHGSIEAPSFPTNVLFWGNEVQVRSLGVNSEEGLATSSSSSSNARQRDTLVIDIPRELFEDCLSDHCEEEVKSPVMTTLRSLKRLLSRGKRVVPSPRGSSSVETEQV